MSVTFHGNQMTLEGAQLKVGETFPDFNVVDNSISSVTLQDTKGVRVFLAIPSLDTSVCDMEVKKFNSAINEFGEVYIYAVSMDLPFAQARWAAAQDVKAVKTLSDYKNRSFGIATGTLIKELSLLSRAVFIVNSNDVIEYVEYISEITEHPDYEKVFEAARKCK